jgi:DNA-binding NtrC family response regulator
MKVGLAMRPVYEMARRFARGSIPVLVMGETGVGKEHMATFVHQASSRSRSPMVQLNCAAITESLFESELFGHERGAFTGAHSTKVGLLEAAGDGTIFLDEVGELSLVSQAKVLRALETRTARRVGGTSERPIRARFVAATNVDLYNAVSEGKFRADLLYRLEGALLEIPPLRHRRDEIEPLARHFLSAGCEEQGLAQVELSRETIDLLSSHPWHGNIRELKNAISRAVLLADTGVIHPEHLSLRARPCEAAANDFNVRAQHSTPRFSHYRGSPEASELLSVLASYGGNQTLAGQHYGVSRRTLARWLDCVGIPRPRKAPPSEQIFAP